MANKMNFFKWESQIKQNV